MPGNYPEESIQHSEHSESLKSRIFQSVWTDMPIHTKHWSSRGRKI